MAADFIDESFKNAKVRGDITLYAIKTNSKYVIWIDTYGDNINLMDSGNQLYSAD